MVRAIAALAALGAALPQVMGSIRCNGGGEDPAYFCGDGVVDNGESCDDGAGNSDVLPDACRTSCRPARCGDGVVDSGEACDDSRDPGCDGSCQIRAYCGDGVLERESGEGCDDGNVVDGDGCSAGCRSETCGNGLVEEAFEECDDGNFQSHDGCSSGCTEEHLWWTTVVSLPAGRVLHAATWDASRLRLVVFGGHDGDAWRDDLVESGGETWSAPDPAMGPEARIGAAFAHHPLLGGGLLLGGLGQEGRDLEDEWLWDGTTWRTLGPVALPPPRARAALVFDEGQGRMILFGGGSGGRWSGVEGGGGNGCEVGGICDATPLGDTWVRSTETWEEALEGPSPSPRMGAAAVYDASLGGLLLYGGFSGHWLQDTWVRDATGWAELALAEPGPLLEEVALFHHRPTGVSYLVGASPGGTMGLFRFGGGRWEEVERVLGYFVEPLTRRFFAGALFGSPPRIWLTGGISAQGDLVPSALQLDWVSGWPEEDYCSQDVDRDRDGLSGCEDPDCLGRESCP